MDQTVLITGVGRTRGIGAAIARRLADEGWVLALAHHADYDRRVMGQDSDVGELVDQLRAAGARVELLDGDLADPQVPARLVDEATERLGALRAVVMSHCESVDSAILDTTVDSFDRHYAVNVRAAWLLLRALAEQAVAERAADGEVAGARSVLALTSDHTAFNLPYGATKAALDRLVIAGATELGELRVQCNVVNPGPIDTGWMDERTRDQLAAMTPGGRLGGPETVADLVAFLLSEQGRWINGQRLYSDGGFNPTRV